MQVMIKGAKSLLEIPALLKEREQGSVLFITGQHLLQDDSFLELCAELSVPYDIVHPPDGVLQVDDIPSFTNLDTVIAIGGGKVMDFAKGILFRHSQPAFFIAAPTTAGSGSEATPIAVFYNRKEKVSLDAPHLLPAIAILDPALLAGLPRHQRAISGADALAQSIESVWNAHSRDDSEKFALTALELLWQNLNQFVNGAEEALNDKMLWAAYLAGKAITITRTTGPHALSYFLTAHHGVPHGQAVALTLPLFFLYNEEQHNRSQMAKIYKTLKVQNAQEAFTACRQMMQNLGLATTLQDLQLQNISLDKWLQSVNQQRFSNNPVPFNSEKLKALFQRYLY